MDNVIYRSSCFHYYSVEFEFGASAVIDHSVQGTGNEPRLHFIEHAQTVREFPCIKKWRTVPKFGQELEKETPGR
jgi:hypothetical protein